MKKLYFASPLFSNMEYRYNASVVADIRKAYPDLAVYLPQEQGDINDKNSYADSMMIAKLDTEALLASDVLVAVIDGITIDAGVASEIGVAYQAGIPVIGLYTDSRQQGFNNQKKHDALAQLGESQFSYVNLYTVGLIKLNGVLVDREDLMIAEIADFIK
ncbi:nucleoside 2-deoxyribosyltransferase [Erysipelothrix sp. HDW6C]|uniref:nucleoside 2-deoxyribosyltransferase n=1 Tax=Erysipelothrix sp. HDW6C TaxID=2714930 RepID=UPI00140B9F70|nr:nucleoside 2-deoxyribosyltransferase [Erysipelothrix sp. HDW6C]QIK69858.1 nucleoside 2-deoxyribosyltransferase [Erysipelothrix sp. HDW6C]